MSINHLELAKALIRRPSVTPEDHGALDVLQQALEPLGFKCTKLTFSEEGEPDVDNLYARLGTGAPFLCFAGHTDVVPPGDPKAWTVPPFEPVERDGYLIGRGAEDMKAAIACFAEAVSRYLEQNKSFGGSIGFIITGDEEGFAINGTRKMVKWMQEQGEKPNACIVGEPTNPEHIGDMVKIGRRGSMNMVLTINGKQGHVAYPHLADNPMTPLVQILHDLKFHTIDTGTEYFPPSNLEITSVDVGNPAKNVIPGKAEARINIRFNSLHTSDDMKKWVESVIQKYTQSYHLEVRVTGESFLTKPGDFSTLVSKAIHEATGKTPELTTTGGTSDARFIKDICQVVEFGTTGKTAHMVDEKVRLSDLSLLTESYFNILTHYFKN